VQKFGGSSLADREKLLCAARIIRKTYEDGNDVVVVVSAQGNTTDRLMKKAKELCPAPDARELDALLATGEQESSALCALALAAQGVPARSLCAWQLPLLTDTTHGCAAVTGVGVERLRAELASHRVAVVTGFQGVSESEDTTTLGRGGSDLSAVVLAAALRANRLQIFTDVDGIYTADPRICPGARHLAQISYCDMLCLAQRGAQVLHDRSVALAEKYGVAIEVLSCAEGSGISTVCADAPRLAAAGVTQKGSEGTMLCSISLVGDAFPSAETLRMAISALEKNGIAICAVGEGGHFLTLYVSCTDADKALCVLHEMFFEGGE